MRLRRAILEVLSNPSLGLDLGVSRSRCAGVQVCKCADWAGMVEVGLTGEDCVEPLYSVHQWSYLYLVTMELKKGSFMNDRGILLKPNSCIKTFSAHKKEKSN